jgi:hypothetical protein
MKQLMLTAVAFAAALSAAGQGQGKPPSIHFSAHGATISGATPTGRVVLFGVGVQPGGYYVAPFKWSGVLDCDKDGGATVDFGTDVSQSTIWGVVDVRTGEASLVTPSGRPVPQERISPYALRQHGGTVSEFAFKHPSVDLVYVDPAGGVWTGATSDGSKTDRDGPNGVSTISVDDLRPLGTTTGTPGQLKPGGRLIAIDAIRMEAISLRLDAAMIGQAP